MNKKYTITITFKHFDSKPLVVQSDQGSISRVYDPAQRQTILSVGYPSAFEVVSDDVLSITIIENPFTHAQ